MAPCRWSPCWSIPLTGSITYGSPQRQPTSPGSIPCPTSLRRAAGAPCVPQFPSPPHHFTEHGGAREAKTQQTIGAGAGRGKPRFTHHYPPPRNGFNYRFPVTRKNEKTPSRGPKPGFYGDLWKGNGGINRSNDAKLLPKTIWPVSRSGARAVPKERMRHAGVSLEEGCSGGTGGGWFTQASLGM